MKGVEDGLQQHSLPLLAYGYLMPGRYCLSPPLLWHSLRAEPFSALSFQSLEVP